MKFVSTFLYFILITTLNHFVCSQFCTFMPLKITTLCITYVNVCFAWFHRHCTYTACNKIFTISKENRSSCPSSVPMVLKFVTFEMLSLHCKKLSEFVL